MYIWKKKRNAALALVSQCREEVSRNFIRSYCSNNCMYIDHIKNHPLLYFFLFYRISCIRVIYTQVCMCISTWTDCDNRPRETRIPVAPSSIICEGKTAERVKKIGGWRQSKCCSCLGRYCSLYTHVMYYSAHVLLTWLFHLASP